jgi:hypothetical protein
VIRVMPSFVRGFAEVDPVSKFHSGSAEVGEDLLLVSRMAPSNGLEFHHSPFLSTIKSARNLASNLGACCLIEMGT